MSKPLKVLDIVARWLFILALPAVFLTASIAILLNSHWLFTYDFRNYGISRVTGLPESELEKTADGIIKYWNSSDEYINIMVTKNGQTFPLFNEREIEHMKDVKGLVRLDYKVLAVSLIIGLAYAGYSFRKRDRRRLAKSTLIGSSISLTLIILFGIGSVFNFDRIFLQFHLFSFANNLWQLDPTRDYLIMLVPQGFFNDAALMMGGITAALAAVCGGVSGKYLRDSRNKRQ